MGRHKSEAPVHRAGLPGHAVASRMRANEISLWIVPLDPLGLSTPPTRWGFRGTCGQSLLWILWKNCWSFLSFNKHFYVISWFYREKIFREVTPLLLRFNAYKVTLSGFTGGEYLPLPASKGPAFPFLLTLDGYPTSPADCVQKQRSHFEKVRKLR